MTDIDYDKMWKEIIDGLRLTTNKLPYEKTVKEFAEETNTTEEAAREYLNKQTELGKMNKRTIQQGKIRFNVYSPVINENM